MGHSAFRDCHNLSGTLTIGKQSHSKDWDAATAVHDHAFAGTRIKKANINANRIFASAFEGDEYLAEVKLYDVSELHTGTFRDCAKLNEVNLGTRMHQMLSEVFAGCSKLKTVVMGDMIPWIYDKAFEGCPLEKIIVETPNPPAMDSLGDGKASDVFGTYGLGNIHVYTYPDYVAHYEKAEDDKMGSVTGGGSFLKDSEITIKAEAFDGFIFLQWNDGDTNAERTVKVTEDKTYIASFTEDTQAVEEVQSDKVQGTKVIQNGVLYLKYNRTMYNVQGQKVER